MEAGFSWSNPFFFNFPMTKYLTQHLLIKEGKFSQIAENNIEVTYSEPPLKTGFIHRYFNNGE
jgi:hypothetical protein